MPEVYALRRDPTHEDSPASGLRDWRTRLSPRPCPLVPQSLGDTQPPARLVLCTKNAHPEKDMLNLRRTTRGPPARSRGYPFTLDTGNAEPNK